jgi:hypothetical protein
MAYQTPKTNWLASDVVQPADMNRIEQNTVELKKAATIDVADANGYFTTTPKTVENVLQELGSAVTTGKSKIATAISAMNQAASSADTFDTLSSKIRAISTDATAGTGDVLSGKTFYSGGSKQTGIMPNNGAVIITPSTVNQNIPAGYHNGSGYVKGDANLVAGNIVKGASIFGVNGSFKTRLAGYGDAVNWVKGYWGSSCGGSVSVDLTNGVFLKIYSPDGTDRAAVIDQPVDLTYVSTVVFHIGENDGNYTLYMVVSTSKNGDYNTYNVRTSTTGTGVYSLDVTSLTGLYYLRMHYGFFSAGTGSSYTASARVFLLV